MDQPAVEILVRLTARLSAAIFVLALIAFAFDSRRLDRLSSRFVRLFVAFVSAHTVHFAAVLWLAWVSAAENIRVRGGWLPALILAGLFYASAFGVWRAWRRVAHRDPVPRGTRRAAHAGVAFIALVFLATYASRVLAMPLFALAVAALTAAVAMYFVRGEWPSRSLDVRHEIL